MDFARLDTRCWSLSLGVAAATMAVAPACGPTINPQGESETDEPPPPPQCETIDDCNPGYECIDRECVPNDYYCADGGCCGYGYGTAGGCCDGGCYYYECYGHADCADGALCAGQDGYEGDGWAFGSCVSMVTIPECADGVVSRPIPLQELNGDQVIGLAFVDTDGDGFDDLVVSHASGEVLLYSGLDEGPPTLIPIPDGVPVDSIVSGEFDGLPFPDLAMLLTDGRLIVLAGEGGNQFALRFISEISGLSGGLVALNWNGDDLTDVAGLGVTGAPVVVVADGNGGLDPSYQLPVVDIIQGVDRVSVSGDGLDDIAVMASAQISMFFGSPEGDVGPAETLPFPFVGVGGMVAAHFDGDSVTDFVQHVRVNDWTLIQGVDVDGSWSQQALLSPGDRAVHGDFDGDGRRDVIMVSGTNGSMLRGSGGVAAPIFECTQPLSFPRPVGEFVAGDLDGNGISDLVFADTEAVYVQLN